MQVIVPAASSRAGRGAIIGRSLVAAAMLGAGIALGWLLLATSALSSLMPAARPGGGELLVGIAAWAAAFVAPAALLIVGLVRLLDVIERAAAARPRRILSGRAARSLGNDYAVAVRVSLPDGRPIPELVVGPFGAAVIAPLPPASVTRRTNGVWELRTRRGWVPLENPLEKASRDAERVRRWFASHDRDHIVRVYAAVVGTDPTLSRTPSCAVIPPDRVRAWIDSLPAERTLTASRREGIVRQLRELR